MMFTEIVGIRPECWAYQNLLGEDMGPQGFTPVLRGDVSAGAGTYSVQKGRWLSNGLLCWFQVQLVWSAHTGTGDFEMTGFPLKQHASALIDHFLVATDSVDYPAGYSVLTAKTVPGDSLIEFRFCGDNVGLAAWPVEAAGEIRISGHYMI